MIKIIDNFFPEQDLKLVKDFALNKAFYTPRYFSDTKEKNKENYYGSRFDLINQPKLLELFKKQAELNFKIKIKKLKKDSGIDLRKLDHFKPHVDSNSKSDVNILIMIHGDTAVENGTVFYTDNQLDIHVGFKENRGILFPSNKVHSPHACKDNVKRYTATLFVQDYEV